jgi:hypothetical protein
VLGADHVGDRCQPRHRQTEQVIPSAVAVQDVHTATAQHPRGPRNRRVEGRAAHRKGIHRNVGLARALCQRGARVRNEADPMAAPLQLADDQKGPVDLSRPGPLAVDVYDVHGPGSR